MLREQLNVIWPDLEIIAELEDGPTALLQIEQLRPDFAFLDIRMPGLTGLQVARAVTVPTRIVFATAFDSYAVEAFEANAVDYILKPVELPRLAKVVTRLRKSLDAADGLSPRQLMEALAKLAGVPDVGGNSTVVGDAAGQAGSTPAVTRLEWLQVPVGQQVHMVHVDDVVYFESDNKYSRVVTSEVEGLIRASLKELLAQLDEALFLQTHRGVVVNRRFIRAVHRRGETMEIELRGRQERIRVSTAHHHQFKAM
ncbi:DNA-binding response regulator, LytR/AlgR family [Ralstonia sp. 25mfcol4.1]|nr:DNA-binding response regulator, LytR/AlgR family [Ralstonia sp. 25mfcol4.1]